jgi:MinD superfamily P-loop ATPase
MKELIVISGKGGTGKTSIAASFAVLANNAVLADCDVDAADLHLILTPTLVETHDFYSRNEAVIVRDKCTGCGICAEVCRFEAIRRDENEGEGAAYAVGRTGCEGCGVCVWCCPERAIDFPERLCGRWMVSDTRRGPMVHAKLNAAAENSGKLVSIVRREARRIAEETNRDTLIVDGPPGIGCPVIASVTGASQVLVVTEPTVSGKHDLERVVSLTKHFGIPTFICVNKWDINPGMTEEIERGAIEAGVSIAGRIRYDGAVTAAQIRGLAAVETGAHSDADIREVWRVLGL